MAGKKRRTGRTRLTVLDGNGTMRSAPAPPPRLANVDRRPADARLLHARQFHADQQQPDGPAQVCRVASPQSRAEIVRGGARQSPELGPDFGGTCGRTRACRARPARVAWSRPQTGAPRAPVAFASRSAGIDQRRARYSSLRRADRGPNRAAERADPAAASPRFHSQARRLTAARGRGWAAESAAPRVRRQRA